MSENMGCVEGGGREKSSKNSRGIAAQSQRGGIRLVGRTFDRGRT